LKPGTLVMLSVPDDAIAPVASAFAEMEGVSEFSFVPPQFSAAVLLGVTVVFGGLAMRRLARKG